MFHLLLGAQLRNNVHVCAAVPTNAKMTSWWHRCPIFVGTSSETPKSESFGPSVLVLQHQEQKSRDHEGLNEDPMVNVDMTPWYYVRTLLLVTAISWFVLLTGRIVECTMGERMLVTNPGEVIVTKKLLGQFRRTAPPCTPQKTERQNATENIVVYGMWMFDDIL